MALKPLLPQGSGPCGGMYVREEPLERIHTPKNTPTHPLLPMGKHGHCGQQKTREALSYRGFLGIAGQCLLLIWWVVQGLNL